VAREAPGVPTSAPTNGMAQQMNQTVDGQQWLVLINPDNPDMRRMMSTREVQAEVRAGTLARETLVWRAGMAAWQSISSVSELGMSNNRPTVPRARAAGWDAPLTASPRPDAAGDEDLYAPRSHAQSPQLVLELIATGAAVLLFVAVTSYSLFAGGAFQAGSPHTHGSAPEAGAQAKAGEH
jgi:hypothetical protein